MKYRLILGLFLVPFILLLAACGSSTTPSGSQPGQTTPSGSQVVQVTLSDNTIDSSLTTFTAGMPFHFVVTNTGHVAHQFVMKPMGMDMEHMSVDEMHPVRPGRLITPLPHLLPVRAFSLLATPRSIM